MICYRDMTFCAADDCAKSEACHRALTDAVREDAARQGLLVSVTERMDCYEAPPDLSAHEIVALLARVPG